EPVVEATLMAETESDSDETGTEMQDPGPNVEQDTDEEPGFFARLFGSDDAEPAGAETPAVESTDSAEPPAQESVSTAMQTAPDTHELQVAQAEAVTAEESVDAGTADEDQFGFFDRLFSAGDNEQEHIADAQAVTDVEDEYDDELPTRDIEVPATETPAEPVAAPALDPADYITDAHAGTTDDGADVGQIRPLAIQGDADAQLQLAEMYYQGKGLSQDYTQAFLWYRRAAQQGNVDAQYKLGNIYLMGEGIDQDDKQAAIWYEKAADQGHAAARHNYENLQRLAASRTLASIEKESTPVRSATPSLDTQATNPGQTDDELATRSPDAASRTVNSDEDPGFWASAGEIFGFGDEEESGQANTTEVEDEFDDELPTRTVVSTAGEQASSSAIASAQTLYDNGMAHAFGDGVRKDYKKAAEYFQQAAEQGHAAAQYRLGIAYAYGEGVQQDPEQSIMWYRKAAQQGNQTAQRTLASMYLDGNGVPRDKVMAHAWFSVVADSGNVLDIRRRDMLEQELSEPELSESERISRERNSRLPKL
ncbi:MAG: hypothetical protein MI673_01295, partial [Thiotrichales bacterium]|nr:hypothetical protein [Thiotrichales bacterium]